MRCRDFFVHLYKDAAGDHWEFDHVTWAGIAAEPLRYRVCKTSQGATIMTGCLDTDTNEIVWIDLESEATLDLAMLNVVDRVFSEAGGFQRSGSSEDQDEGSEVESAYAAIDELDLAVMDAYNNQDDPQSQPRLARHRSPYGRRRGRKQRLMSVQQWMEGFDGHPVIERKGGKSPRS